MRVPSPHNPQPLLSGEVRRRLDPAELRERRQRRFLEEPSECPEPHHRRNSLVDQRCVANRRASSRSNKSWTRVVSERLRALHRSVELVRNAFVPTAHELPPIHRRIFARCVRKNLAIARSTQAESPPSKL